MSVFSFALFAAMTFYQIFRILLIIEAYHMLHSLVMAEIGMSPQQHYSQDAINIVLLMAALVFLVEAQIRRIDEMGKPSTLNDLMRRLMRSGQPISVVVLEPVGNDEPPAPSGN